MQMSLSLYKDVMTIYSTSTHTAYVTYRRHNLLSNYYKIVPKPVRLWMSLNMCCKHVKNIKFVTIRWLCSFKLLMHQNSFSAGGVIRPAPADGAYKAPLNTIKVIV